MSGNSCESALVTAPMVSDFARAPGSAPARAASASATASASARTPLAPSSGSAPSGSLERATSASEEGQLELADLELVAVLEPVRVHPLPVDVGAVQRARVVEQPVPAATYERRVLTRDGDVVEEDVGLRRAADRHPLAREREGLAHAPAARADHERAALRRDVADVDRLELARLVVDHVRRGRDVLLRRLGRALEGAALRAVVRPFGDDEAALGAVAGHLRLPGGGRLDVVGGGVAAGEDVRQALHVGARDHVLAALVLLAQPVHELGAQDVDLAVEDAAPVGHLLLLVRELLDEILQLLVRERPQVGEGVHHQSVPLLASYRRLHLSGSS